MKKIKKFLIVYLGLFVFLTCMLLFFVSKIHFIELKADSKTKTQALYTEAKPKITAYLNNYKGRYLWRINLKEIAKKIESIYLEGEVHIQRKFPNRLIVFLKEETAFLLLLKQDHRFYSVSPDGHISGQKNRTDSLNFPILRGKAFEKNLQLRQRVLDVLFETPKKGDSFSLENVSEILYNEKSDSFLFYLVSDYFIVELKAPPASKTIKNIDFVLNYLRKQGRTKALIDAQLDKKIIVKKIK
ncbi:MAG: FtsQ-type POTRA domain-containing protein [Oligoflexia bacterium]|nr:FtsQ-type POTRA domain-containing protein [Oligoflexia bacterium]